MAIFLTGHHAGDETFVTRTYLPDDLWFIDSVLFRNIYMAGHKIQRQGDYLEALYAFYIGHWVSIPTLIWSVMRKLYDEYGNEVKVGEVAFATVYNILSNLLLSSDFMSFEKEIVDGGMKALLDKYVEVIGALNVSDLYPILGALDLQGINKKTMEVFMSICAMWEPIIKDKRQGSRGNASSQTDFLGALIDISCTDEQINYLLLEIFASSANTIEWAMAELIESTESMKEVREQMTREIKQDEEESALPYVPLAAKFVPFVLAPLIHNFDWSLPHGNDPDELDMNEKASITLMKEIPLVLIPTLKKK
ncbi:probable (S)-N-methylcoclaurine 3'-hydroxylase isozyme 2 [Cornus florida]|uniref:probable (S)-N-methylcoclaurine 3'-hydroxylase isozyme 2 n=1 Tax=Cornus florida TaxID=4283 RepID=UPI0028A0AC2C|nr:probable (S)-N-methylcoclaurine 3'-hydroxylase isozyme 2 [Cornus florida]